MGIRKYLPPLLSVKTTVLTSPPETRTREIKLLGMTVYKNEYDYYLIEKEALQECRRRCR